jgi:histidinol-phosphate/aromatic aminotransferase/cobyric acid decarboxylase-like protein/adenosyl cobinamide kinase/adenosyl cobinamide phosphate guanylyltransferase
MSLTLVLGGTRSGKSAYAERIVGATGLPVRYVATADGSDSTMAERIAAHVERRPPDWQVVEVEDTLTHALAAPAGTCTLLDGLGVWIAGVLHRGGVLGCSSNGSSTRAHARVRKHVLGQVQRLVHAAAGPDPIVVVAEHAGEGLLPADAPTRAWLDLLGEAVQRLSVAAERVELVVAGRALTLDGAPSVEDDGRRLDNSPRPAAAAMSDGSEQCDRDGGGEDEDLRRHGDLDVRAGDADHAVNVMAGGPPAWLRAALRDALQEQVDRYPDEREACEAIALAHGRDPDEVVPTNGAAEALWLLPAALRPRLAACVHPAFTEAEAALRAHGVPVVRTMRDPRRDFALDPASVPPAADLVIVGNPASPSGTLDPAATLLALRRPNDRVLVVDEAFMDLVPGEPATLAREPMEDVIVVRSLTKALAIPGLRAGYALAGAALAARLRAVRPPWSANALALAALAAAARRPDALAQAADRAQSEREDLTGRLAGIPGVRMWPSAANFCLVEVPDGPRVLAALRARAIAVRPAASFPGLGAGHLRITARDAVANERLAQALQEAVAACGASQKGRIVVNDRAVRT